MDRIANLTFIGREAIQNLSIQIIRSIIDLEGLTDPNHG